LLTFFYRQMAEIIRRGYLFIAQPPLYKVTRQKKERFLKDDDALSAFLLDSGVEDLLVRNASGTQVLTGAPLRQLLDRLLVWRKLVQRLERAIDSRVLQALVRVAGMRVSTLQSRDAVAAAVDKARAALAQSAPDLSFNATIGDDAEHGCQRLDIAVRIGVAVRAFTVGYELLSSSDYGQLCEIHDTVIATLGAPAYVAFEQKADGGSDGPGEPLADVDALFDLVDSRGRKGLHIQRYKGLGEMNPETLWETTMNPETRVLLEARIDDAVRAEEMFSILMGDEVEPRREFIDKNAMNVRNLDI
jgi:DNA gyrase subunit B